MLLALILAVGLVLRTVALGSQSLWADEALTQVIALFPPAMLATAPIDPTGPLYYWLYRLLMPEGADAALARLPSVAAGMATIGFTYGLGRRIGSRRVGLIAAALVAAAGSLVDYSQEARAYALAVMLIAASAWALAGLTAQCEPQRRKLRLILFWLATAAALSTHLIGLLWALPALVLLMLAARREAPGSVTAREAMFTGAAVALPAMIELRRMARYTIEANGFTWLEPVSVTRAGRMIAESWLPFAASGWLGPALAALLLVLAAVTGRRALASWIIERPLAASIGAALLAQPVLLFLVGTMVTPVLMPRTLLPAWLGFALLVALLAEAQNPRWRSLAAALAVLATLASTLAAGTMRPREAWRLAAEASGRSELVLVCPLWKAPAFLAAEDSARPVAGPAGSAMLLVRPAGAGRAPGDRAYFEAVQWPMYRLASGNTVETRRLAIEARVVTVVSSECGADQQAAMLRWFAPTERRLLWAAPQVGDSAPIQLEYWETDSPRRLTVTRLR